LEKPGFELSSNWNLQWAAEEEKSDRISTVLAPERRKKPPKRRKDPERGPKAPQKFKLTFEWAKEGNRTPPERGFAQKKDGPKKENVTERHWNSL